MSNDDRLKIINTGVKAFTKCENKGATCDFRLAQEGQLYFKIFLSTYNGIYNFYFYF